MSNRNQNTVILAVITLLFTISNIVTANSAEFNQPHKAIAPNMKEVFPLFVITNIVLFLIVIVRLGNPEAPAGVPSGRANTPATGSPKRKSAKRGKRKTS